MESCCPAPGSLPEIKLHPPTWLGTCCLPAEPWCLGFLDAVPALKGLALSSHCRTSVLVQRARQDWGLGSGEGVGRELLVTWTCGKAGREYAGESGV